MQLFVKFLSDLVPYEPPEYLKVIVRNVSGIYFGGAFNANYWKREGLAFIHVGWVLQLSFISLRAGYLELTIRRKFINQFSKLVAIIAVLFLKVTKNYSVLEWQPSGSLVHFFLEEFWAVVVFLWAHCPFDFGGCTISETKKLSKTPFEL